MAKSQHAALTILLAFASGCQIIFNIGEPSGTTADPDGGSVAPDAGSDADAAGSDADAAGSDAGGTADASSADAGGTATCPLAARAATVGLWCFEEGSGTMSGNLAGPGPAVTGIAPSEWVAGGGFRSTTAAARIPHDPAQFADLTLAWTVEAAIVPETFPGPNGPGVVLERALFGAGAGQSDVWVSLAIGLDGSFGCGIGRNGLDNLGAVSASDVLSLGTPTTIGCRRLASGAIELRLNGAAVAAVPNGTAHAIEYATARPFTVGYSDCPVVSCPVDAPRQFDGIIRAIAIHNDAESCPVSARAGTVGLWCFEEGSGTMSSNLSGAAPDVSGIVAADWVAGGGIRPTASTAMLPDDPSLDLDQPWTIQAAVQFDGALTHTQALVHRAEFLSDGTRQWVRFQVSSTGSVVCEVGVSEAGGTAFNTVSDSGVATSTAMQVLECRRAADGSLSVWKDGSDVSLATSGTPNGAIAGDDQPVTLGWTSAPTSVLPDAPQRVEGVLRAVAIHGDM